LAKKWQVDTQGSADIDGDGKEVLVVNFNNGQCKDTNVDVHTCIDRQWARIGGSNHSGVRSEVDVDTKFEIESGSEDLDSGTGLNTDSDSNAERCFTECAFNRQLLHDSTGAISR
jgi:hypothetical protein